MREVGEGKRGMNCDGGRSDWGGEHTPQYTDGVLWNCTPETRTIFYQCHLLFNKKEQKRKNVMLFERHHYENDKTSYRL